jgi:LuxR family maltose regulon positive regulatory protein
MARRTVGNPAPGATGRGSLPDGQPPPLAEAKLAAPRLRVEAVQRPRILRALDEGEGTALTLVAAPPGYGKTTAVRAWCANREVAFSWVTLDDRDNDPVRFWTYVATAVNRVRDGLGRPALRRMSLPGGPIQSAVDELMNGIASLGDELVLVLDDVQNVTDTECLASIDYAVDHLPATSRLIVMTRIDPALRLPQLRARGALAEIRADKLAFSAEEAHELLVERGRIALEVEEVEMLCRRTEGWPAALYLASLWLRGVDDAPRAVRDFGGNHRFVADYLSREVLDSLDHQSRWFVLRASVLGRFTAELCDGVFGRADSASVLDELERSNLFVTRLEHGGWFRVHPVFAEFARYQLASVEPEATAEIHRDAAGWLRSRGFPVEAVEHAAAAGDDPLVAEILAEHHLTLIRSGGARTLLHWVRPLADTELVEHPELAMAAATAAAMVGRATIEQRRFLQVAGRARSERPDRFTGYVEAGTEMVRAATIDGGVAEAVAAGRRAVEIAQAGADEVLVASLAAYARALYFSGELDDAWAAACRAVEHPEADRRRTGQAFARSTLALVALDQGRLASARAHAERAKALLGHLGSGRSWLGANASVALGCVLAAEGHLAEAERELVYAEQFFRDEVATVHHAWLLLILTRVRVRRGRLDEAEASLCRARESMSELADSGRLPSVAADVERELEQAKSYADNGEVLEPPSQAELAVLRLLASDLSAREIGLELFLSPNTVRSHTRAIYRKLAVNSRADAVARAGALGLIAQTESPR